MALYTPGLDRNAEMQRQPLGTFSALRRPSPVASQYKRQSEMYGQALRTLSRAARRGDAGAAIDAINLRDKANADGFTPGGINRSEDMQGNIAAREQSLMQRNADLGKANTLDRRTGASVSSDTPTAAPTRTAAALDMLEGAIGTNEGANDLLYRGRKSAEQLGVENPDSILSGDRNLKYRQTLDSALGQAKSPEEIAALKERGSKFGISSGAFDRRAKWWDSNR